MLYPIELLGRAGGSMLASIGAFVMPARSIRQPRVKAGRDRHARRLAFCMIEKQAILQSALNTSKTSF